MKYRSILTSVAVAALALTASLNTACVSTGSTPGSLSGFRGKQITVTYGETTPQEVIAVLGQPYQSYTERFSDGPKTTLAYSIRQFPGSVYVTVFDEDGLCIGNDARNRGQATFRFDKHNKLDWAM